LNSPRRRTFYFTFGVLFRESCEKEDGSRSGASVEKLARSVIVLFDEGVAFAGERFEFLPVQNSHRSTGVFDYAFSLEHARWTLLTDTE
jgi:hypothetical protein